ncbi:DUF397 domain-containing protein [Kitasatospora sp. NA04385]|uniref:DUF397 domain-containing protein n=1 Tax=Kitasatospora sp. NA04385 TaxID=2742135 RepID=UPI0020CAE01D|nr:DUF397 domain-containing protein [Kitasatospora sp. NA04385]
MPENWVKSSYSNDDGGACIEVDTNHPGTVRDSKDPAGPRLRFTPAAWAAFVSSAAAGEFGTV